MRSEETDRKKKKKITYINESQRNDNPPTEERSRSQNSGPSGTDIIYQFRDGKGLPLPRFFYRIVIPFRPNPKKRSLDTLLGGYRITPTCQRKPTQCFVSKVPTFPSERRRKKRRTRVPIKKSIREYYEGHSTPFLSRGRSSVPYHPFDRQSEKSHMFSTQPSFKRHVNHSPSYPSPHNVYTFR